MAQLSTESSVDREQETTIPSIGFGTYRTGGYECYNAVTKALEMGYRHIDTAMAYENEAAVGRAIANSTVSREELFLTTKIKGYPEMVEYDRLISAANGCADRLGVESLDLVLVHWWNPEADMEATFDALNTLVDDGLVGRIGVSNFSVGELERARQLSDAPIATNQVEYHPHFGNHDVISYCQENDITVTAYSPLAGGRLVGNDVLDAIGDRYAKTGAQVAIRWLIQQENVVTIPKAVTPEHMRANLDVFDFELSAYEMEKIGDLEEPFWPRENREGGYVYRARSVLGKLMPDGAYERFA